MAKSKKKSWEGHRKTLVLSADYQVVNFTSDWRGMLMMLKDRAEVLAEWKETFKTASSAINIPSILRLKKEHKRRNGPVRFHRVVVFRRDGFTCQYCGRGLSKRECELEHVIPQDRGGPTTYKNCVTACRSCNHRKANRTPEEAGMTLLSKPSMPTIIHLYNIDTENGWHPEWTTYLGHLL